MDDEFIPESDESWEASQALFEGGTHEHAYDSAVGYIMQDDGTVVIFCRCGDWKEYR